METAKKTKQLNAMDTGSFEINYINSQKYNAPKDNRGNSKDSDLRMIDADTSSEEQIQSRKTNKQQSPRNLRISCAIATIKLNQ